MGIGNLWMELTATWILVLLASGIYLWWPRAIEATKPLLKVRWRRGGRIRWRDLHALIGIGLSIVAQIAARMRGPYRPSSAPSWNWR